MRYRLRLAVGIGQAVRRLTTHNIRPEALAGVPKDTENAFLAKSSAKDHSRGGARLAEERRTRPQNSCVGVGTGKRSAHAVRPRRSTLRDCAAQPWRHLANAPECPLTRYPRRRGALHTTTPRVRAARADRGGDPVCAAPSRTPTPRRRGSRTRAPHGGLVRQVSHGRFGSPPTRRPTRRPSPAPRRSACERQGPQGRNPGDFELVIRRAPPEPTGGRAWRSNRRTNAFFAVSRPDSYAPIARARGPAGGRSRGRLGRAADAVPPRLDSVRKLPTFIT